MVLQLCHELKQELFRLAGVTSVEVMETFLACSLLPVLHPHHTISMLAKRNIISMYSQRPLQSLGRTDFLRIKQLCEESIKELGKVDPGYPLWKAETLKDLSTALMNLARTDFEAGSIDRPEFLAQVKHSMKMVEEASKCKSSIKVERKMDDGEVLKEEFSSS